MRRPKHKLDMLPLLDIFMVVLFVFATIQEGKIEDTTREAAEHATELQVAQQRAQKLQKTLEDARIEEHQQLLEKTSAALEREQAENIDLNDQLNKAKAAIEALEAAAAEARAKLDELEANTKAAMQRAFESDDQFRQEDVLDRLLKQNSVFEVEIRGVLSPEQGIANQCCFRDDPRAERWRPCGQIPARSDQREEWFRSGASGLLDTLRETKGGNAMTIIRQDAEATFQIGARLEELVRSNVPEQKVYNEGIIAVEVRCQ